MKTITFKLGWINATVRKVSETCYQLSIVHPVKCVQCFRTKAEAMNVLKQFELAHKSK